MRHLPIQNQTSTGLLVWRMQDSTAMPRPHIHADLEINFLLEGKPMRYLRAGRIFEVPMGKMAFFWGGIPHQLLSAGDRCDGVWITLPLALALQWDLPGNAVSQLLQGDFFIDPSSAAPPTPILRWVEDFESGKSSRRRVMLLEIESRIHRMLLTRFAKQKQATLQPRSRGEAHLQAITAYLAASYTEPQRISAIAGTLGLNPHYMMGLFRSLTGMSILEYLRRLRVSHAQQLLISTDHKIVDVAMESGFESVSAFYAAFQQFGGPNSPGTFRRHHRFF